MLWPAVCVDLNAALTSTLSSLIKVTSCSHFLSTTTTLFIHFVQVKYDAVLTLAWSGPRDWNLLHLLPSLFIWLQQYLQYKYSLFLSAEGFPRTGIPSLSYLFSVADTA